MPPPPLLRVDVGTPPPPPNWDWIEVHPPVPPPLRTRVLFQSLKSWVSIEHENSFYREVLPWYSYCCVARKESKNTVLSTLKCTSFVVGGSAPAFNFSTGPLGGTQSTGSTGTVPAFSMTSGGNAAKTSPLKRGHDGKCYLAFRWFIP